MAKTLISRLDAENIVRAAVDPETHEATGDVYDSVNDISYPFGGGGGLTLKNPIVTITFNGSGATRAVYFDYLEDGEIKNTLNLPIGETVVDAIAIYNPGLDVPCYMLAPSIESAQNIVTSDLVNCTTEYGEIYVTDPTQPASITYTYEVGGE